MVTADDLKPGSDAVVITSFWIRAAPQPRTRTVSYGSQDSTRAILRACRKARRRHGIREVFPHSVGDSLNGHSRMHHSPPVEVGMQSTLHLPRKVDRPHVSLSSLHVGRRPRVN